MFDFKPIKIYRCHSDRLTGKKVRISGLNALNTEENVLCILHSDDVEYTMLFVPSFSGYKCSVKNKDSKISHKYAVVMHASFGKATTNESVEETNPHYYDIEYV